MVREGLVIELEHFEASASLAGGMVNLVDGCALCLHAEYR